MTLRSDDNSAHMSYKMNNAAFMLHLAPGAQHGGCRDGAAVVLEYPVGNVAWSPQRVRLGSPQPAAQFGNSMGRIVRLRDAAEVPRKRRIGNWYVNSGRCRCIPPAKMGVNSAHEITQYRGQRHGIKGYGRADCPHYPEHREH